MHDATGRRAGWDGHSRGVHLEIDPQGYPSFRSRAAGHGTVVLAGTHAPDGVSTGALTLLTPQLKLEPWTLYVGIPARPLKKRESKQILEAARRLLAAHKT